MQFCSTLTSFHVSSVPDCWHGLSWPAVDRIDIGRGVSPGNGASASSTAIGQPWEGAVCLNPLCGVLRLFYGLLFGRRKNYTAGNIEPLCAALTASYRLLAIFG